ncbi:phosphatase PAP2 family protein [Cognatiyoonia koreensis]|uniref:phosphatase PAP2 family protein n=1 Tax=Cognatiyoonia koreensis TaxID=364200 RepID=UPI0013F4C184|nr:phosphatase PAP2 family protein [Cognatiyoonia koreensis]
MFKQLMSVLSLGFALLATQSRANDRLVEVGDFFHQYAQIAAIGYTHMNHGIEGSVGCLAGSIANNEATLFLKKKFNQRRPNGGGHGMPSGHTSRVASSFGCMLGQEGWTTPTLAFGAATLITAYSRVEGDYHTPKQVFVGAVLGTTFGYLGTQHLYVAPNEIQMTIPLGGHVATGPEVSANARKSLIAFANNR